MARKRKQKPKPADRSGEKGWLAWVLGSSESFEGYFAQTRSLALSFVLIAPLLLVYELALVSSPATPTGARRMLRDALTTVFHSKAGPVLNILVLVLLLMAVFVLARRGGLRLNLMLPMVAESAAWAAVLVGIAVLFYGQLRHMQFNILGGKLKLVVQSIGAGVYEEIVFRLFLTSVLYLVGLKIFQERTNYAAVFAVALSALVFALCHGVGWGLPFLFFFTCGVFFSVLYTVRGLGVAVYTHVIYDIVAYLSRG